MPIKQRLESKQLLSCGLFDEKTAKRVSVHSSEWAYIRAMRKMLKKGGKGIAFIRASLLYLESEKEFRKELLESGTLEGVVLLPEGLLLNTGMQIAMLVLSENNNRIKMVNAASYYEKIKYRNVLTDTERDKILDLYFNGGANLQDENRPSDDYIEVAPRTIADNTYSFDPMRYVLDEKVCFTNARKLSEGTRDIFRGAQITSDKQKEMSNLCGKAPNGYLLNLANISNGYMDEELVEVHIDKIEKYKKYMLQDGDVIISARGTKISTAVAENIKNRKIIATGNLIVVRCNDTLEPYYLKAFFDSDDGNLCLSVAQTGSTIFAINPKQLCELQYDSIDMEKQKRIAEKEKALIAELHETIHRIETLRQNISGVYDDFRK